ncbi:patatin-like phospholipase family protein [Dysgonomonadaceae bacterium zrk40]|nr:patatin-like phospholipase family protein [Dysgonomonadaceae bacterium zrk40]
MKKVVFLLMMLFCFTSMMQAKEHPRKKVAVVLSGGSAKGFVHVGVLKVLERAGIPIDYIAGTSMGAVVGGIYAVGYDAEMIDSLIQLQEWNYLMSDNINRENLLATQRDRRNEFIVSLPYSLNIRERSGNVSLPRGVFSGQNLYSLFLNLTIGFQHEMDFDDLPTPFGCVAADARTGKEVVFRKGILPEAIRASMAIPGVFTPVEKDSMLLIDGGLINNYPVDLARRMGADIVIGVIIPPDEKEKEQNRGNITEIAEQLTNFVGKEKKLQNIDDTDILITPDVHPYGLMDFQKPAIDSLIARGEQAAMEQWEALMTLKASLGITGDDSTVRKRQNPYINLDTLLVDQVSVEGVSARDEKRILQLLPEQIEKVTRKELDAMTARIFGAGLFSRVTYRLDGNPPFNLVFLVEPKEYNTLNLGIHFDTSDMAAILANTTVRLSESYNSMIDITTRLSRNPYLQINYTVNNNLFYRGGISYRISNNNLSIYNRGRLSHQFEIMRNALDLNFSEFYFGNVQLHLGAGFEYFDFSNLLERNEIPNSQGIEDHLYINYMINGIYDNLNSIYFPSSGQYFSFRYSLHTDNFVQMKENLPLSVLNMNFAKPLPLSEKTFLTPRISARYVMNDSVPFIYRNFVGGRRDGHYLPQQIALQGSAGMELLENMVVTADAMIYHQFRQNNYLYANLNYTLHNNHLYNLYKGDDYWGFNAGYSFLSIAGPLRLELGYSGLSRKFHPYVSFGYHF